MRKLMMTMMLLLLAVTVATAQRGQSNRGEKLLAELDLTAEQQAQIEAIKEEGRAQMKELRQQNPEQRPDRASMKKMRESAEAKMQAILTPEQREKLATIKAERKAAWKSVDKEAMKADLKAHTETKIKPVIAAARARFDEVITTEDQAAIERLRPVFASKPVNKRMRGGQVRQQGEKPSEADRAARKATVEQWKTDHAAEIAELKALTAKYKAELTSLKETMAPQQEQWEKEKREIAARYLPEGGGSAKGRREKGKPGKAGRRKAETNGDKKGKTEDWPRTAAFLLMKG